MCSPLALAYTSAGLQIAGNYMGQKATAKAAAQTMEARKQAAVRNMNYMFQNFDRERQDAFDATLMKLDELHRSGLELNSKVEAATNEQMQGRTAGLINRNMKGDMNRTATSLKDNYARKSNEIDLNKEAALLQTKDTIAGINTSAPQMPSAFSNFLNSAGIILDAYTMGQNQRQKEINDKEGRGNR